MLVVFAELTKCVRQDLLAPSASAKPPPISRMMPHGNFLSTTLVNLIDMVKVIALISAINISGSCTSIPKVFHLLGLYMDLQWWVISKYSFDANHLCIIAMLYKYSPPAGSTKIRMTMSIVVKVKQVIHIIATWVEVLTCWYDKEQNDNEQGGRGRANCQRRTRARWLKVSHKSGKSVTSETDE